MADIELLKCLNELRLICNQNLHEPDRSTFQQMRKFVENNKKEIVQFADSYLILPIMAILKSKLPDLFKKTNRLEIRRFDWELLID